MSYMIPWKRYSIYMNMSVFWGLCPPADNIPLHSHFLP